MTRKTAKPLNWKLLLILASTLIALIVLCVVFLPGDAADPAPAAEPQATATAVPAADDAADDAAVEPQAVTYDPVVITTPIAFTTYQEHFQAQITALMPDTVVTWEQTEDEAELWFALAEGNMLGVVCAVEDGQVDEVMFIHEGQVTEDTMGVFFGMSTYTVAALATASGYPADQVLEVVTTDMFNAINGAVMGTPVSSYAGYPLYVLISVAQAAETAEESVYTFQLMIDLIPEATGAAPEAEQ